MILDQIPIPRKGGPLDGIPFKCFKSVYDYLEEGQLFGAYHRVSRYAEPLRVEEVTYRLIILSALTD